MALTLTDQPDQPGGISHLSRGIASSCHQGWKNGLSSLAGGLCGPAFFVLLPSTKETQMPKQEVRSREDAHFVVKLR